MPGLFQKQYQDEDAAREYLEKFLWKDGPVCPHCGIIDEATKLEAQEDAKTHGRKALYQCNACRKQFTVTIGTIFEDSHIPLHKWLMAIHLMCSSKQGRSALQLQRNLELGSYRTAWFMCHRIRWAMTQSPMTELLMKGVVEWMRPTLKIAKKVSAECRGQTPRRLVLALIECGGNVRSFPIERATVKNIGSIMRQHIDPESRVFTDEFPVYYYMKPDFPNHHTINNKSKRVCAP